MKISLPGIKIENKALKYGYSNARVKAMKGLLLTPNMFDELVRVRGIEAMIELLQRTHYKDDLIALSLHYKRSTLIELASGRHFVKVANKIRKIAPKSDTLAIEALLRKWEITNLKFLINARMLGKKYEEIRPFLVPVGSISEDEYKRIAVSEQSSVFEEIKRTSLGKEMLSETTAFFNREAWQIFNQALKSLDKFLQLQTILDAYNYVLIEKALSIQNIDVERIRKIFKKEIDAKNIMIIERLKVHSVEKAKIKNYLIKGGTLTEYTVKELLAAKDLNKVITIVGNKFQKLSLAGKELTLPNLEIALEKAIAAEKVKAFARSILSIGVLLGFLLLKEEELNNLRKIAKAKEFGLSEQETKEMLVVI